VNVLIHGKKVKTVSKAKGCELLLTGFYELINFMLLLCQRSCWKLFIPNI